MSTDVLNAISSSFIASAEREGFNGVVASTLSRSDNRPDQLRSALAEPITSGNITAVFARTAVNMHIKRFPDLPITEQLEYLQSEELNAVCLYPTENEVRRRVDLSA